MGCRTKHRENLLHQWAGLREHRRHKLGRALEHASYTFDIVGDYGSYRDLHRHRILTQERQRLTTRLGYTIPESLIDAGLESPVRKVLEKAASAFEVLGAFSTRSSICGADGVSAALVVEDQPALLDVAGGVTNYSAGA